MRGSILTAIPLLALAAAVTGCSERTTATAPLADAVALNPAGFISDRPYTWSVKCSGDFASSASWSWTTAGAAIAGTAVSATCSPSSSSISGAGVRPAAADGFSACVNGDGIYWGSCQTWTFDPSGSFKAQLKGTATFYDLNRCPPNIFSRGGGDGNCKLTASATLNVDS